MFFFLNPHFDTNPFLNSKPENMVVSFQGNHRDQESDKVSKDTINGGDSSSSRNRESVTVTKQEKMVESASQKHALFERERRKRINNHYDSLRRLFPQLLKTDKASVLSETVQRLKELKNMVVEVVPPHEDGEWHQSFFIPGENDEVSVGYCNGGDNTTVQAIICCEDRPDLIQGLSEAIQSVGGKTVKAEIATVGGRTKVDMVVEWQYRGQDVGLLRRALKGVVENQIQGRTDFMGHGSAEPEFLDLGRRIVDGLRPNDQCI